MQGSSTRWLLALSVCVSIPRLTTAADLSELDSTNKLFVGLVGLFSFVLGGGLVGLFLWVSSHRFGSQREDMQRIAHKDSNAQQQELMPHNRHASQSLIDLDEFNSPIGQAFSLIKKLRWDALPTGIPMTDEENSRARELDDLYNLVEDYVMQTKLATRQMDTCLPTKINRVINRVVSNDESQSRNLGEENDQTNLWLIETWGHKSPLGSAKNSRKEASSKKDDPSRSAESMKRNRKCFCLSHIWSSLLKCGFHVSRFRNTYVLIYTYIC